MPHVALLGDSIFDNGAYTSGGPDVVTQLRAILPAGVSAGGGGRGGGARDCRELGRVGVFGLRDQHPNESIHDLTDRFRGRRQRHWRVRHEV